MQPRQMIRWKIWRHRPATITTTVDMGITTDIMDIIMVTPIMADTTEVTMEVIMEVITAATGVMVDITAVTGDIMVDMDIITSDRWKTK